MTTITVCARHPDTETALRCSRCGTPICPKCLVQTPVGARCKDCARISRSPIYTVSGSTLALAAGAALVGGIVMGLIWGFVLLPFSAGFFSIFIGIGLGYVFARVMQVSTGYKRGPVVVGLAWGGILIAWGMQFMFLPTQYVMYDLLAVGIAFYLAYNELR